jgi:hypothetical protein
LARSVRIASRGGLPGRLVQKRACLEGDLRQVADDRVVLLDLVHQQLVGVFVLLDLIQHQLIGVVHQASELAESGLDRCRDPIYVGVDALYGRIDGLHGRIDRLEVTVYRDQVPVRICELVKAIVDASHVYSPAELMIVD